MGAWDCSSRLLPCPHCTPPHPSPESIISLNRPPGNVDDYVGVLPYLHCGGEKGKPCTYFETLCLCHMSSARSTSDGRGPVTRKRVPDREEQGKPGNDARRGRCHLLEAGFWPLWMTLLPRNGSHKSQVTTVYSQLRLGCTGIPLLIMHWLLYTI